MLANEGEGNWVLGNEFCWRATNEFVCVGNRNNYKPLIQNYLLVEMFVPPVASNFCKQKSEF